MSNIHLLTLLEFSVDGPRGVQQRFEKVPNLLHNSGEEFLLRAAFTGGRSSTVVPDFYYLGLDNRQSVEPEDVMSDVVGEPGGGGYERRGVSSSGDFSVNFESDHYLATSPIVAFRSTVSDWGPVSNLFLMADDGSSQTLISTIVLPNPVVVETGRHITMRLGLSLRPHTS